MFPEIQATFSRFEFDSEAYTRDARKVIAQGLKLAARAFVLAATNRIPVDTGFLRGAYGNLEDVVGYVAGGKVVPLSNPKVRKKRITKALSSLQARQQSRPNKATRRKQIESTLPKGKKRAGATKQLKKEQVAIDKEKTSIARLKQRLNKLKNVSPLQTFGDKTFRQGKYYYPVPVGRAGRQRGVLRGNPILKTTTSGKQFATPTTSIFMFTNGQWRFTFGVNIRYYGPNDVIYGWQSQRAGLYEFNGAFANYIRKNFPPMTSYIKTEKITERGSGGFRAGSSGRLINYCGEFITSESDPKTVVV